MCQQPFIWHYNDVLMTPTQKKKKMVLQIFAENRLFFQIELKTVGICDFGGVILVDKDASMVTKWFLP